MSTLMTAVGVFLAPIIIPNFFPKYLDASMAIQIMSLSIIAITIDTICTSKLLSKEKSKVILIGGIMALSVMVSGVLILGSIYGTIGIAMTYVLTTVSKAVYLGLMLKKYERNTK